MRYAHHFDFVTRLAHGFRLALVGGAICLVPAGFASAEDIADSVTEGAPYESSVVVSKSKVEESDMVAVEEGLQPITISDEEPQLADPEEDYGPVTVAADTTPKGKVPVKMASNSTPSSESQAAADEEPSADPHSDEATSVQPLDPDMPQPAIFHGIQPGVSTKRALIESWGSPDEVAPTETGQLLLFHLESFRGVEVLVEDGLVSLMKISLRTPSTPAELADKVAADPSEAAAVFDAEAGRVAAYAYPERGIVMVVDQPDDITPESAERVSQMILQPVDAETFCLRAEQRPAKEMSLRIADLERALELDSRSGRAHALLAAALADAGQATQAEAEAKRAVDIEPENIAYRQLWGETLAAVGKYDNAVLTTREVLDNQQTSSLVRARALHQMGQLAAIGDANICSKAIGFQNMAITEAEKLVESTDRNERRAAKRLLVEAHLAIAVEVSRRDFDNKMADVAPWASRASALAEEMIETDGGDLGLRIRVAQQSLAALANFKPSNDPEPLIHEIEGSLKELQEQTEDRLYIGQLEWIAGVAYEHALEIEHHRRHPKQALTYSEKAITLLADQADTRRDSAGTEQIVGNLYFHIGAVHAVHQSQHGEAVKWYDRAFPLVAGEGETSDLFVPRHEGEALVSMAVSYWEQNDRERAIELTEMGADLIEQAVSGGVIDRENLAIPYGNLAAMHKKLGNYSEAQRYAKLVDSVKAAAQAETKPAADKAPGVASRPTETSRPTTSKSQPSRQTTPQRNTQQRSYRR